MIRLLHCCAVNFSRAWIFAASTAQVSSIPEIASCSLADSDNNLLGCGVSLIRRSRIMVVNCGGSGSALIPREADLTSKLSFISFEILPPGCHPAGNSFCVTFLSSCGVFWSILSLSTIL
ncbi:hypothetical protein ACKS0A_05243 [Histoplasma ohiense]